MEWAHRILGRVIGVAFVVPLAYFALRRKLTPYLPAKLTGMALLIGVQGLIGWYMVKSGLEESLMDDPTAIPRVSQYRLAAHLGTAFLLYIGMLGTGLAALRDWQFAKGDKWSGVAATRWQDVVGHPRVRMFTRLSWGLTGLVFLTALSGKTLNLGRIYPPILNVIIGAFVAGLDAGLLYNEFPLMGGRLAPPSDELFSTAYAKSPDHSDLWWRNMLENPTTTQFDHRVLVSPL
jgi:cytochrome c oxidase assembly protein subunit 15